MPIEWYRTKVASAYPNVTWALKVKKMSDKQVIAIYHRLLQKGSIQ